MSNTVTNISYANTFGEWVVATNALINENNVLAAGDYTKSSGTLYLNESTQNSLQANGTVIVQKELRVQGTGSGTTLDRNLVVGGQIYFTNTTLGLTHTGQANLNGLVLVQGPGIGISVSNNAYVGGNTTIRYNTITNNVQANASINTQTLSVTTNSYSDTVIANTQVQTATLFVTNDAVVSGVNIVPFLNASFLKANAAYQSQNTTGIYANSAFEFANSAGSYANSAYRQANGASIYANGAFSQANAVYLLANNILNGAQTISSLTLSGSSLTALGARADFASLYTTGSVSVGGDFVINGTTVYNSPTLTLSSDTPNQFIYLGSFRTANGAIDGVAANAYIRYNETYKNWEINDVNNSDVVTTYSRLLSANSISDDSTSTSVSTLPTSRLVTGLYLQANAAFLKANASYGSQNTTGNYANSAFTYANAAYTTANSSGLYANSAFNKANSAYAAANAAVTTFIGTSGSFSQNSVSFSSNNGITFVVTAANNFAVSTSQDLRTTASPTFASLTLTAPLAQSQGGTGATSQAGALTALLPTGTTAGYVLTTGGPGSFYWAAGSGGGAGGATPGTTINSTCLSYTANGVSGYTGNSFTTPTWTTSTQLRAYINGVRQFESEYSANSTSNTITFTTTPSNGDAILIEVDGYYVNPYYANNIAYGPVTGSIPSSANTIQLAIDSIENRKAALIGATFTGIVSGITIATGVSNTAFATTAHVQNSISPAYSQANTATTNAATADSKAVTAGSYANSAYTQANTATTNAATADSKAVTAGSYANSAYTQANTANTNAVTAGLYANSAFVVANSASIYANGAFVQSNSAFLKANNSVQPNSNVQFYSIGSGTSASGNTGEIRATGTIIAGYSDDQLKTKLGTIENALDKVMSLTGFYFEPNQLALDLGYIPSKQVGVSAQEVEKVLPEVVVPAPIDNKYLTVQYEKMVPLLIEAIKELKLEIDALKGNKQ